MVSDKIRGIYDDEAKEAQKEATIKGNKSRHQKGTSPVVANLPQLETPVKPDRASQEKGVANLPPPKTPTKIANSGDKKPTHTKEESLVANLPQAITPAKKSRDKAAEAVGVSGKLADAARTVRKEGTSELAQAVESGEVAVSAAAEVAKAMPSPPVGGFRFGNAGVTHD